MRHWQHALLALVASLAGASCDGDAGALLGGPASCDDAADHLIEVCDPFTGEGFRAECEREGQELFFASHLQCLANLRICDEPHLEACGYRSLAPPSCDASRACDQPWTCDTELEECVRCLDDGDCAPGRGCLLGLCFEMGTDFYETLRHAQASVDGGAADAAAGGADCTDVAKQWYDQLPIGGGRRACVDDSDCTLVSSDAVCRDGEGDVVVELRGCGLAIAEEHAEAFQQDLEQLEQELCRTPSASGCRASSACPVLVPYCMAGECRERSGTTGAADAGP